MNRVARGKGGSGQAPFGEIERGETLSNKVAASVQESIGEGRLERGDRLPSERELGEMFGVSRTVIREAVRSLMAKGLVEPDRRGYRVAELDSGTVTESMRLFLRGRPIGYDAIHEVRSTIEVALAGLAAEQRTSEDVQRMYECCDAMAAASRAEAAASADLEFHRAVAVAAHNELFLVMLDSIRDVLLEIRLRTVGMPNRIEKALRFHRRIAKAIEAGDAEAADEAMRSHLEDSRRAWIQFEREQAKRAPRRT